jgi:hypothetical protein
MNMSKIRAIELAARRERARHMSALLAAASLRIAEFGRSLRQLAQACTDARLRHN